MKKLFSFILLLFFLFNMGGFYLWFGIMQHSIKKEIRKEIKKGLREEDLSLIIIPVDDTKSLKWIENNKEFRYQDEMYDVVKIKIHDQKKYLYCINDIKEKQLITKFNKNNKSKKETDKNRKRIIFTKYFQQSKNNTSFNYSSVFLNTTLNDFYKSNILKLESPPPKIS